MQMYRAGIVGIGVGRGDGANVGGSVGTSVGPRLGNGVGINVGSAVAGRTVGSGEIDGWGVGSDVDGETVGALLTKNDGVKSLNDAVHQSCKVTFRPQVAAVHAYVRTSWEPP